jgi:hypothetical protein
VQAGKTEKIFGCVAYRKGNSPSFNTHDPGQEAGWKNASTSLAWGRRGADAQQARVYT